MNIKNLWLLAAAPILLLAADAPIPKPTDVNVNLTGLDTTKFISRSTEYQLVQIQGTYRMLLFHPKTGRTWEHVKLPENSKTIAISAWTPVIFEIAPQDLTLPADAITLEEYERSEQTKKETEKEKP